MIPPSGVSPRVKQTRGPLVLFKVRIFRLTAADKDGKTRCSAKPKKLRPGGFKTALIMIIRHFRKNCKPYGLLSPRLYILGAMCYNVCKVREIGFDKFQRNLKW